MKVAALLTNYNTWDLTSESLAQLLWWSEGRLSRVLVIDDCSKDLVPSSIPPMVEIQQNSENIGYVASVNKGFEMLQGSDVVILLDSDAYPLMDAARRIGDAFEQDQKLGALGMQLFDRLGRPSGSHQMEPTLFEFILGQYVSEKALRWIRQKGRRIALYSCAVAIRTEAFFDVGGFDERFDFLDADMDFSLRLQDAGWGVTVDRTLAACHKGGGSFQSTGLRVMRFHTNRWRLLAKQGRIGWPMLVKVALATRHAAETVVIATFGWWLFRKADVWRDRLQTRARLLGAVWDAYGVEK